MINDFLRQGFMLGLGIAATSKEKMERYLEDLVVKGQLAPTDAKELMSEYIKKGEKVGEKWSSQWTNEWKEKMNEFGFATKEDLDSLKERIEKIEQKLKQYESWEDRGNKE